MHHIIGVDLGGTQLRTALADAAGRVIEEVRVRTAAADGPGAVIDQILEGIAHVRASLPQDGQLLGVGIGAPGPLDPYEGVVFTQPNMSGWVNVPLRDILAERTGLPVELGNDANAAVLGEWYFGAGVGLRHLVYITVSTGIGGGVIADGQLLIGHQGAASEVGHHIVDWATGAAWEDLAAGPGLAAAAALDREGELIGIGLVNMLYLFSPQLILLGGGVVVHNPFLIERARLVIQERALAVYRDVPVRLAALGDRAGLLGAVALFLYMHDRA